VVNQRERKVMRMNQIILASHGGLAAGMRSALELIVGEVPHVHVLSATRDETESVLEGARRLLESFAPEDPVYVLTDLLNGSVNNTLLALLTEYPQVRIVCGMNACLALNMAAEDGPISNELLEEFIRQAQEQIADCNKLLQNAAENEEDDL